MSDTCIIPGLNVPKSRFPSPDQDLNEPQDGLLSRVVLGGGCFWCVEAVFLAVDGVQKVVSGYAGGSETTATYEQVCSGTTGHAEVIDVHYDPSAVSFGDLLRIFMSVAHDPTQLNRQGNDRGTQYRSAIFYETAEQKQVIENYLAKLDESGVYPSQVQTTVEPLEAFYPAETYHQNFAARNPYQPYVMAVAAPKMHKLVEAWPERLRPEYRDDLEGSVS